MTDYGDEPRLAPVLTIARQQHGAISARQLREVLHPRVIQRMVADGLLTRLWRGMYAIAGPPPSALPAVRTRLAAAELTLGGSVIPCLDTALEIHGFPAEPSVDTHVLSETTPRSTRAGLVIHRHRLIEEPVRVGDVLVEHPAESAVRVAARQSNQPAVLAILDAALHSGAVDAVVTLGNLAVRLSGRGVRELCRMVPWANRSARSAADSWIRWLCIDRHVDLPEIRGCRPDADDEPRAVTEADFRWSRYRLAATLGGLDDPDLCRRHVVVSEVAASGWTHLLLESLPECPPGLRPIHPAGQARLQTALAFARRSSLQAPAGADATLASRVEFRPQLLTRPRRDSR